MANEQLVVVLGAGALGAAMAERLGERQRHVVLWNRSPEKAHAVAEQASGVVAVDELAQAVAGADVLLTVLRDGDAVTQVMNEAFAHLGPDVLWVQASTVGPEHAATLAELAQNHRVAYLDAPVSGSTTPARRGELVWLVSGDAAVLERVRPVLDDLAHAVLHVGGAVEASALKVLLNAWMTATTVVMSDVLSLCDDLRIDHGSLAEALRATPLNMAYALGKLEMMDADDYRAGFAVQLALKDLDLVHERVEESPVLSSVRARLEATIAAGHAGDDLAAVDALRPRAAAEDERR